MGVVDCGVVVDGVVACGVVDCGVAGCGVLVAFCCVIMGAKTRMNWMKL